MNVLMVQRRIFYAGILTNVFYNIHDLMVQRCRCYINIPMNEFVIANVVTMQRRRYYTNIPMNVYFVIIALMVQRRRCYINIPMNTSITTNVLISQLGTSCSFDSPGLARNEPTPGEYSQGDSTPSVLSFFCEVTLTMNPFMAY